MSKFSKVMVIASKIAMSFIGRTLARLRHIQRMAKLRVDAISLVIRGNKIFIYDDHRIVLEAERDDHQNWRVGLTDQFMRLTAA